MKKTHDADDRTLTDQSLEEKEISSSPIGRLMSDDIETDEEQSAYVSGFERNQPEDFSEPVLAPNPAERRRPKRERPSSPVGSLPETDEDFFEAGIREARAGRERDRERRRQPNPDPRPAVRATVPTPKRMAAPPPRRDQEEIYSSDSPPEDKYDTFRQRYNPGDLISAGRGGRPTRRGAPPRDGDPSGGRGFDNDGGGDTPNVLRIVAVAGVFVLLLVLVIMTVNRNSINRRYNEAQERIAGMEIAYARTNSLERELESLEATLTVRENRIEYLESQLAQQNNAGTQAGTTQPGTNVDNSDIDDTPPGQGGLPAYHVVQPGQSLTGIARIFYGDGTATENHLRAEHIARYNDLPNLESIQPGQTLTIPPLP